MKHKVRRNSVDTGVLPAYELQQMRQQHENERRASLMRTREKILEDVAYKSNELNTLHSVMRREFDHITFADLERLLRVFTTLESKTKGHYHYPNLVNPKVNEKVLHRNKHENVKIALESLYTQLHALGIDQTMIDYKVQVQHARAIVY